MIGIRNHSDTQSELNIAKARLQRLNDKKDVIFQKYFSSSRELREIITDNKAYNDKYFAYVVELDEPSLINGKSLNQEIEEVEKDIKTLNGHLENMRDDMLKLTGIESAIYCEIVINGSNISKAVEKVAFDNEKEPVTLWKYNYPKIKKYLKKLEKV
jgi:hypothetical protein